MTVSDTLIALASAAASGVYIGGISKDANYYANVWRGYLAKDIGNALMWLHRDENTTSFARIMCDANECRRLAIRNARWAMPWNCFVLMKRRRP